MIDGNEVEKRAMELFRAGQTEAAQELQRAFLAEVMASGEDYCSCPHDCALHGNCVACVIVHRGHADHLPRCFWPMVNERLAALSGLTEHSLEAGASK